MASPLQKYNILIADSDQQLSMVLKKMLASMGFPNVEITRSGTLAREKLLEKPFDFLITERNIQHIDGLELINRIRRDSDSPNPTLPIIMLTGRAEKPDVALARDSGINEYVIKPFSAQTIFNRLERIIEQPRQFVATTNFMGPDRRHKGSPPPGTPNRRVLNLKAQPHPPRETAGKLIGDTAKLWMPDFSLKQKLGTGQSLQGLITPSVLKQAQETINSITEYSLQWVKENLAEIKTLYQKMVNGDTTNKLVNDLSEAALTINSRAGTFGYGRAAEVAYKLSVFCRNRLQPHNPLHHTIVQKHIEVLEVILSSNMSGMGGRQGEQIAIELHNLVLKYTA